MYENVVGEASRAGARGGNPVVQMGNISVPQAQLLQFVQHLKGFFDKLEVNQIECYHPSIGGKMIAPDQTYDRPGAAAGARIAAFQVTDLAGGVLRDVAFGDVSQNPHRMALVKSVNPAIPNECAAGVNPVLINMADPIVEHYVLENCRTSPTANVATARASMFCFARACVSLYMRSFVSLDSGLDKLGQILMHQINDVQAANLNPTSFARRGRSYTYIDAHNAHNYVTDATAVNGMQSQLPDGELRNATALVDLPRNAAPLDALLGANPRSVQFYWMLSACASSRGTGIVNTALEDVFSYYSPDPEGGELAEPDLRARDQHQEAPLCEGPVDLLLVRPNIEHNMLGAIVARGGQDELGATFWGQTEMSCYDDAQHGIWGMSYKYHAKALVTNNKNLMRLFDIAYDGYCGGMDASFVDASRESIDAFRDASFNRTEAYSGDSFLVFVLPRASNVSKAPRLPNPITWNWAGRVEDATPKPAPDRGSVLCRDRFKHNLMHSTGQPNSGILDASARLALADSLQMLGMDNLQHHITTTSAPPGLNMMQNMTDLNNVFYHGYLAVYDKDGRERAKTKGSGHLGPCWEGVASVREGRGLPQPTGVPSLHHLV